MIELIFILIGIGITIIVLKLPSYTPEQVGSKKLIARRKPSESDSHRTLAGKRKKRVYGLQQPGGIVGNQRTADEGE